MIWQTITEPQAVRLLRDDHASQVLGQFMHKPCSVKAASDQLGLPLKNVHDCVRNLTKHGLLRIAHLESRRGRPIKHYQASADGFFVPFHATSAASYEKFIAETLEPPQAHFNRLFAKAGIELIQNPAQAGYRFYAQNGNIFADLTPSAERFDPLQDLLEPEAPALLLSYTPLRLTRDDAKRLQLEMMQLLLRYSAMTCPEAYLAHIGLTPGESRYNEP
jgi:hypothetical protein